MVNFSLAGNCLYLEKVQVDMFIGILDQEHEQTQPIEVSIAMQMPALGTNHQDDPVETYDYTHAYNLIETLAKKSYVLVEYFAYQLAQQLLQETRLETVEVIIGKRGAFSNAQCVGCRIQCSRSSLPS